MRLRTQIVLSVLPLFVAVGGLGAALRYSTEESEMRWGLRQEAEGYVYAVRGALGAEPWRNPKSLQAAGETISAKLKQLSSNGKVKRVVGLSPDGGTLFDMSSDGPTSGKLVIESEMLSQIRDGKPWFGAVSRGDSVRSFLPVLDADGHVVGTLGVELGAAAYWLEADELYHAVLLQAGLAVLIGMLCALALARIISRGIGKLEHQARGIQFGFTPGVKEEIILGNAPVSIVQELCDLSDGLKTLQSTMSDVRRRTQMDLFERERFLLEDDLTDLCRGEDSGVAELEAEGFQVLGLQAQTMVQGCFLNVFQHASTIYVVHGQVRGDDIAARLRNASAAARFSVEVLKEADVSEAWKRIRSIFSLEYWTCVRMVRGKSGAEMWTAYAGDEQLRQSPIAFRAGRVMQHNLSDDGARRIESYLEVFKTLPPREIKTELNALVRQVGQGTCVLIGEA